MLDKDDPKFKTSKERSREKTRLLNDKFRGEVSDGSRRGETGKPPSTHKDVLPRGANPAPLDGATTGAPQKKDRGGAFVRDPNVGGYS